MIYKLHFKRKVQFLVNFLLQKRETLQKKNNLLKNNQITKNVQSRKIYRLVKNNQ
jgi:hypothetical protein